MEYGVASGLFDRRIATHGKDSAVTRLFAPPVFAGFGPAALHGGPGAPVLERVHGQRPAVLKKQIHQTCPRQPGVYGMIDTHGDLVYVGKAKNLRARLLTYFRPHSRDPKAGRILAQARTIVWEPCPDEFAALYRELELIRRWRPRFNVQGQPNSWQHAYVCLGRQPAPYAFLARTPPGRIFAKFGPIRAGSLAREAVRRFNDWFKLRDCPQTQHMAFGDQADLFALDRKAGCLRLELLTCTGPCAGACSRADYLSQVESARAFLAGEDATPLRQLESAMKEAAVAQIFERAAVLRDKLKALSWLHRQLARMRGADAMGAAIYPVKGHDEVVRWYVLHSGRAVATVTPETKSPTRVDMKMLLDVALQRDVRAKPADRVAGVILLDTWFRRYPRERQALIPLQEACAG